MAAFRLAACVSLLALLAGCLSPGPAPETLQPADEGLRPVAVALIDTGINPYHEVFRAAPGLDAAAFAEPFDADVLHLSQTGDHEARMDLDGEVWGRLEVGQLYAFAGTRVFGISFGHDPAAPMIWDYFNHGTGTASLVAREAPESFIVMIQFDARVCDVEQEYCPVMTQSAAAMAWAAEQPWIDIISASIGPQANPPALKDVNPDVAPYLAASRLAHDQGKVLLNSASNLVVPPMFAYHPGPPWVISVGGAQPAHQGEAPDAAKSVDMVANFTDWVATSDEVDGWRWSSGTSYATPLIAGTLAHALALLHEQGHEDPVPPSVLRGALNASAVHFALQDYNPTRPSTNDTLFWNVATASLPLLAPPIQQGWGYVHGGMAEEIARRVLENDLEPPPEKAQTAEYMAQWQAVRESYWRQVAP